MQQLRKPKKGKGPPPPEEDFSDNLSKKSAGEVAHLNFTISPEFKREFKGYALDHEMPMNKLLQKCFNEYKQRHE